MDVGGDPKCKVGRYLYSKESDYIVKKEWRERRVDECKAFRSRKTKMQIEQYVE